MTSRSIVVLATLVASAGAASAQQSSGLATLKWMAGCWELRGANRVTHEQWMAPAGTLMLGMSRTMSGDTVREWEQIRIEVQDGKPTYVARPSGQAEASFPATLVSDTAVVFANPAHDFPQRIRYRRASTDSIVARIEGERSGQTRGIDFPMKKVPCG